MLSRGQAICVWGGPLTLLFFMLAIWPAAQFIPPPSPTMTANEIASLYEANRTGIRISTLLLLTAVATYMAFTAAISTAIKRIEGQVSPLAYTQLISGLLTLMPFVCVALIWATAAFRPERSPELTYMLNDLAWVFLVMPTPSGVVQPIVTAIAVLNDKGPVPVLPRWVGYFNIWVAILILPGGLSGMFKTGPFAWDGLLAFWVPAVVFAVYLIVMPIMLMRANRGEAH